MQLFLELAEELHFGRTAGRLGLTSSRRGALGDRLERLDQAGADVPRLLRQSLQSDPLPTEVPADAYGGA